MAIHAGMKSWIATACGLAMTPLCHGLRPRNDDTLSRMRPREIRHCEERSDAAVHAAMRSLPPKHKVMDCHGLRPRNDDTLSRMRPREIRHCEERSDAAVHAAMRHYRQSMKSWIATACGLAMTTLCRGCGLAMTRLCHSQRPRDIRHCEERSDAAVHAAMRSLPPKHEVLDCHGLQPRNDKTLPQPAAS